MENLNISQQRVEAILEQFSHKRLLVIGDIMLDRFIWGTANRISPEAPVPVVEIERETTHLGGLGNVIQNLVSLGAAVSALSVVGDDEAGQLVRAGLEDLGTDAIGLLTDPTRPTTTKTRIIAQSQQVVRADRERCESLTPELSQQLIRLFTEWLDMADGIILSDYDKGAITPSLLQAILPLAQKAGKSVFIDPKIRNFRYYSPVTILKPNQRAAEHVTQIETADEDSLLSMGRSILRMLECEHVLITRGEAGMSLFSRNGEITHIPTAAREVFDVTGAGDTTIAVLSLSFISGASALEAALLANYAASVVIAKVGTATVSPVEILRAAGS